MKTNIKNIIKVTLSVSIALLTGCATNMKYDCALGSKCTGEPQIYKAGYNNPTDTESVIHINKKDINIDNLYVDSITKSKKSGILISTAFTNNQGEADLIAKSLDTNGNIATVNTNAGLYHYRSPVIYQTWVNSYVDENSDSLVNAHTYNWVYRHSGWQTPLNSKLIESFNGNNASLQPISITDVDSVKQSLKG